MDSEQRSVGLKLWAGILQELAGIEMLWTAVEKLHAGREVLERDAELLYAITKNTYIESIFLRVARLMDPANTGKFKNLSLDALKKIRPDVDSAVSSARALWDGGGDKDNANLQELRRKFLAHNDQEKLLAADPHTLNVPMSDADSEALAKLVHELLAMRSDINQSFGRGGVDETRGVFRLGQEIELIGRTLELGCQYARLLEEAAVDAYTND